MASRQPYYAPSTLKPQREEDYEKDGRFVDLKKVRIAAYPDPQTAVREAQDTFDARAAAYVMTCVAPDGTYVADHKHPNDPNLGEHYGPIQIRPTVEFELRRVGVAVMNMQKAHSGRRRDLLELKHYGDAAPDVYLARAKCLAALAYLEFFPGTERTWLKEMVAEALLAAGPGWCGTFGPGISDTFDLVGGVKSEGNYDMNQMYLLAIAYRYHGELDAPVLDHLITGLLARGRIHRVSLDDTFTSGGPPDDWSRAGLALPHKRIGETENHNLMMMTVRYLTNQLLYQREAILPYDNRRNDPGSVTMYALLAKASGTRGATDKVAEAYPDSTPRDGSCTAILLSLMQSFLRDDFSEYNAKNYQIETRHALLNLCSYAYDHEVRLGARMVLDYVAAHMAVSSSDLRRLLPFRRRNEGGRSAHDGQEGFMTVPLLNNNDADPMAPFFALTAGNVRVYNDANDNDEHACEVHVNGGDQLLDVLGEYRLPPSIHDLFVNDLSRRFYQRLHRKVIEEDWIADPHNADNMELFAGSPSYLLAAGGEGAGWAVDPRFAGVPVGPDVESQFGVAVTTSFMPTSRPLIASPTSGARPFSPREVGDELAVSSNSREAASLIQFSTFSAGLGFPKQIVRNYGVGPDFLCGYRVFLPEWFRRMETDDVRRSDGQPAYETFGHFTFVDKGSSGDGSGTAERPGFYLALYRSNGLGCMEAFDTWLDATVSFTKFKEIVLANNTPVAQGGTFDLIDGVETRWTTVKGTRMRFVIWTSGRSESEFGAEVLKVEEYGAQDQLSSVGDAGNDSDSFLSGTVLNSSGDGKVLVHNTRVQSSLTLDMVDHFRPRRTSESGAVEQAGGNWEVWCDFGWPGVSRGDVCQPFRSLGEATGGVAAAGTIRLMPGRTAERLTIGGKAMRLVAPIGGVTIGHP